jgi:serine/threonine protein kinase
MSPKRQAAPPPHIDGYKFLDRLGSGGFADVYLYEQDRPLRKVAVKVLLADLKTEGARRRFESEANLMAQLSTHPFIVTIYEADITSSGHSYLAMEYCSRPNLDVRLKRSRFSVDEALTVGIQVASAVETAHRAGIAHRDIKPANILVTDYNRPALTDFGISGTMDSAGEEETGMSIPWSPPEVLAGSAADGVKTDIWALGATVYTLLAGRPPFVVTGGDNSQIALVSRTNSLPVPPLGRAEVPRSLELVLATAMSKSPASRYPSAHAFAMALQRVQTEMNLSVTRFEALDNTPDLEGHREDSSEDATYVRGVVSIDPGYRATDTSSGTASVTALRQLPPAPRAPGLPSTADLESTVPPQVISTAAGVGKKPAKSFIEAPIDDTYVPSPTLVAEAAEVPATRKPPAWLLVAAGGVLVLAAGGAAIAANSGTTTSNPAGPKQSAEEGVDAVEVAAVVPVPAELKGVRTEGNVKFTWANPEPKTGDVYMWRSVSVLDSGEYSAATSPEVVVAAAPGTEACIEVVIRRSSGRASAEPARACVP